MPKRTKAQRQARRKKTGQAIIKGIKGTDKFLRRTRVISKAAGALAPFAGTYKPALVTGAQIANAVGYGRTRRVRRKITRKPRGMKF